MQKLIICNACSDEKRAKISSYLLENSLEKVVEGLTILAKEKENAEIAFLLSKKFELSLPEEIIRYYAEESQITHNDYALVEVLKGKHPRPYRTEETPIYEGREVIQITPYEAYCRWQSQNGIANTGFIFFHQGEQGTVVESPISTDLQSVLEEKFSVQGDVKGILLGGITGKFIKKEELTNITLTKDTPVISVVFYTEKDCMVSETANLYKEIQSVSCGKCVLCREGSLQFKTIIEEMTSGKAKIADITLLKEVAPLVKIGAYCVFGQKMPNVLLSSFELFANEFEAHIQKKNCPAGVCETFSSFCILPKECTGCEECLDVCPEDAIEGKKGFIHMIDEDLCDKCGKCVKACAEEAIVRVSGTKPKLPKKLTKVGKF